MKKSLTLVLCMAVMKKLGVIFVFACLFSFLLLIVFAQPIVRAQGQNYIPFDGDTLDIAERDFYKLFGTIEGFQWASFSSNADGSLQATVCIFEDSIDRHIVIERFRSISDLEGQVKTIIGKSWAHFSQESHGEAEWRDTLSNPSLAFVMEDVRRFGVGYGIMFYSPDFSQLSAVYAGPSHVSIHLGMSVRIKVVNGVHVEANAALGIGGDVAFSSAMGVVEYELFLSERVRPAVGIGWGSFSFGCDYNSIVTRGGQSGSLFIAGVEFLTSLKSGIKLYTGYWALPSVSTEFEGKRISLELKRPFIGVRIIGYL